jgi:hypothetical protein
MNDPMVVLARIFQLMFVPLMLSVPLLFVLAMHRFRSPTATAEIVRARTLLLAVSTALAMGLWLSMLLAGTFSRSDILQTLASMAWVLFFPLWFLGAMPTVVAQNPAWGSPHTNSSPNRSASLVNRNRRNPIRAWHWGISITCCLMLLAATLVIGQYSDRRQWTPQEMFLWFWGMIGYALLLIATYSVTAFSIRTGLSEAEPLDAKGSPELQALYDHSRSSRLLSLFWLLGFVQPVFIGLCLLLATWQYSSHLLAIMGSIGGALIGFAGAWIGIQASIQRLKIAQVKASMDNNSGAAST